MCLNVCQKVCSIFRPSAAVGVVVVVVGDRSTSHSYLMMDDAFQTLFSALVIETAWSFNVVQSVHCPADLHPL